jgi:glycosyltransferase 2 family protein
MTSGLRKGIVAAAKLGVLAALCYFILREIDPERLGAVLAGVRWPFLVVPCVLYALCLLLVSVKLKWLLEGYGIRIPVARAFDLNWISGFFGNFLPSSVGGDVYRLYELIRAFPRHPAQTVSAVVLDRGLGLLAMLVLAMVASAFFIGEVIELTGAVALGYAALLATIACALVVLFFRHGLQVRWQSRYAPVNKISNGINILLAYPSRRILLRSLALSFAFYGLVIVSNHFLFAAFGRDVSLLVLLFVIPVINLAAMIPVSINAIGVTEGVGIVLFSRFGYEPEVILGIMLTGRVLLMACSATGGLPFLLGRRAFPQVPATAGPPPGAGTGSAAGEPAPR